MKHIYTIAAVTKLKKTTVGKKLAKDKK